MEICQKPLYEASFALGEMYKLGCFYFYFQNSYFRFHFVIISKLTQTPNNKARAGGIQSEKLKHTAAWSC